MPPTFTTYGEGVLCLREEHWPVICEVYSPKNLQSLLKIVIPVDVYDDASKP